MKKGGVCRVTPWLLLVTVATALPAAATLVVKLDLAELTSEADLIVEARAEEATSVWIAGELFTVVQLRVHEVWKGHSPPKIEVLLPGGTDTQGPVPIAAVWAGQPRMSVDQEYVLFLSTDARDSYHHVVGFSQGLFAIRYDEEGEAVVVQDLRGLRRRGPTGDTPGRVTTTPSDPWETVVRSLVEDAQTREVP